MLKRASVDDFKAWLKQRKPQPAATSRQPQTIPAKTPTKQKVNPDRRVHRSKSDNITNQMILSVVERIEQCTSRDIAKEFGVSALVAGSRLKELRRQGQLSFVGYTKVKRTNQTLTVYAIAGSPAAKQKVRRNREKTIREQVIDYLKVHGQGSNVEMAKALGKKGGSGVSSTTTRMLLSGDLVAENVYGRFGHSYRIFRLANKEAA